MFTITTRRFGRLVGLASLLLASQLNAASLRLTWQDNSSNELGFHIWRCIGAGCSDFAWIADVGVNIQLYIDNNLTSGVFYNYRIAAFNNDSNSAFSNIAGAIAGSAQQIPDKPKNVKAKQP